MYAMMVWIASVTSMSVPETLPYKPLYVHEHVMKYIMYDCSNEDNKEKCKLIPNEKNTNSIMGLFDHNTNNIYLNESIRNMDKKIQDSVLVHELVHYMQFQNKIKYECLSELEELAYKVQSQWLIKNNRKDVYEELSISPLWVFFITRCSGEDSLWSVPSDSETIVK